MSKRTEPDETLYGTSLSLLTDLYQLTMGYGYWRQGMHDRASVFHLFFRRCPFGGRYAIAAGLMPALQWLAEFQVTSSDVDYLRTLLGNDSKRLFDDEFLRVLKGMRLSLDVDAIPEGTVVFPHQPLVRVSGPLWQCQWVETALLNIINFQTLIATKAARVCQAAGGDAVLEFGLRRAQGIDGGLAASRAAYIGGCHATSNVLAGKLHGIPVRGTHAHSWVMSFDTEPEAFDAYAKAMPNNCVFLVDTYDTLAGVTNAIEVGRQLRARGHQMVGIRLDSGDLGQLSRQARQMLDDAGFSDASIVASNDLDESSIAELKSQGACIAIWGVGTNLVTAKGNPALGGVYKLGAIRNNDGDWEPRIKLSEQAIKRSVPGIQQVRRWTHDGKLVGDVLFSQLIGPPDGLSGHRVESPDQSLEIASVGESSDLLQPVMRSGQVVPPHQSLQQIRQFALSQLAQLPAGVLSGDLAYPVVLEERLSQQREALSQ
ncbi:MAG: nicotinate phosphoribosyltransferase [Planctomycetota bacterium]